MSQAPFSASVSVREARDAYLAENGFTVEGYDAKWTDASFLGVRFAVPNTARHRVAIMLHDLHHVATGYGTDLVGEGEISAWEARGGVVPAGLYVASIILSGGLMGLLFAPRRALRAFRRAQGCTTLLPLCRIPPVEFEARYEELLAMTVGELRARLGVPSSGVADRPAKLHAYASRPPADRQVHQRNAAH